METVRKIATNEVPDNIIWDEAIARLVNGPLERFRRNEDERDFARIDREVQRLLDWLKAGDETVFVIDTRGAWGPDTPTLQVINGRIVMTRGYHTEYCAALTAGYSLDQSIVNWFHGVMVSYMAGFQTGFVAGLREPTDKDYTC